MIIDAVHSFLPLPQRSWYRLDELHVDSLTPVRNNNSSYITTAIFNWESARICSGSRSASRPRRNADRVGGSRIWAIN